MELVSGDGGGEVIECGGSDLGVALIGDLEEVDVGCIGGDTDAAWWDGSLGVIFEGLCGGGVEVNEGDFSGASEDGEGLLVEELCGGEVLEVEFAGGFEGLDIDPFEGFEEVEFGAGVPCDEGVIGGGDEVSGEG